MPTKSNKKKKLPARAVATTSAPSKAQIAADAAELEAKAEAEAAAVKEATPQDVPVVESWTELPTDANSKEAQLQALVEKFGPKARKESQRWAKELANEQRMLRTAGAGGGLVFPLYIEGLLGIYREDSDTPGLAERIMGLAKKEAAAAWAGRGTRIYAEGLGADALLAQAWMIFGTLTSVGFPEERVESAIEEVIGKGKVGIVSREWDRLPGQMMGAAKGGDGGVVDLSSVLFEEVLDWLAMECEEGELPRFDGVVKEVKEKENRGYDSSSTRSGAATPVLRETKREESKKSIQLHSPSNSPLHSQVPSGTQTPVSMPSSKLSLEPLDIEDAGEEVEEDIDMPSEERLREGEEVDDDDTLPEEILPKWFELKKQLLNLDPLSALGGSSKPKGPGAPEDPQIKTLKERIQKFEKDPFFDTRQAGEVWAKELTTVKETGVLQSALAQQGQGRRKKNNWWVEKDSEQKRDQEPLLETTSNQEGEDGLFGGIFDGPKTEEIVLETQEKITIRDFEQTANATVVGKGKFDKSVRNKAQPNVAAAGQARRVVEEVVRSKDSRAKVTYTSLSGTTYSCRHSLSIRWSKPEHLTTFLKSAALPTVTPTPHSLVSSPDITLTIFRETVTFNMTSLSVPTPAQAEAYVSTVVLYQLYGGKTCSGGNGYVRLQGVWKDLWAEFAERDRMGENRAEREILDRLRQRIFDTADQAEKEIFRAKDSKKKKKSKEGNEEMAVDNEGGVVEERALADWEKRAAGEDLREEWEERVKTQAYSEMLEYRKQLPMWAFKQEILDALEQEQIIIICGETGCGKSTQVPSFILENELSNGRACRVYCTEPRRISAISLARRVSQELGERKQDLGGRNSLVGYAIRLESCMSSSTRLVYATTGIVMRLLERSPDLDDVTHLVLDEVHERSIDSDFLLIVLKKLLQRRRNLKVILMSATVEAERFSRYLNNAPVLNVPGRTFPVTTQYLEDAIELTKFTVTAEEARNKKFSKFGDEWDDGLDDAEANNNNHPLKAESLSNYSKETISALSNINESKIQYELIIRLIETVATSPQYIDFSKAILVFLPGIGEIRKMNDYLLGHPVFGSHGAYGRGNGGGWFIYPLHSTIASEEQEAAFLIPPEGYRKIVLATNIAETGITIPDVTCVIDSGRHKEMRFDERRQLSRLIETFISKANAKQRRGRAGRVQEGLCFHLFTKERYNTWMAPQQAPEMLRLSLQDLCLRVKTCNLGAIEETLTMALDPPVPKNIRRAIDSLTEVKALTQKEELTYLGMQLSKLPLDVYLGKLVLFGWVYGCLDAAVTIAAILSSKSPFAAPMGARKEAEAAKLAFKKGDSDLQATYAAYCSWRRICSGHSTNMTETQFCQKNYLSSRTLNAIEDLKGQLITCVVDAGLLQLTHAEKQSLARSRYQFRRKYFFILPSSCDLFSQNEAVVNSVIAAGFYPKLLVRDGRGWRNVANNQNISIHRGSVNKGNHASIWLSYYGIMQSSKFYDAHETSHVDDLSILTLCGDIDFRIYAGVAIIDGHRIKFSFQQWKSLIAMKILRKRIAWICDRVFRDAWKSVNEEKDSTKSQERELERQWMEIVGEVIGGRKKG